MLSKVRKHSQHCSLAYGKKGKQTYLPVFVSSPINYPAYPQDKRRLAASSAFNSIYTIFRENESLVDVYTIEIFVHVMQSLQLSQNVDCEGTFSINDYVKTKFLR